MSDTPDVSDAPERPVSAIRTAIRTAIATLPARRADGPGCVLEPWAERAAGEVMDTIRDYCPAVGLEPVQRQIMAKQAVAAVVQNPALVGQRIGAAAAENKSIDRQIVEGLAAVKRLRDSLAVVAVGPTADEIVAGPLRQLMAMAELTEARDRALQEKETGG
jgi:hypothetical protein